MAGAFPLVQTSRLTAGAARADGRCIGAPFIRRALRPCAGRSHPAVAASSATRTNDNGNHFKCWAADLEPASLWGDPVGDGCGGMCRCRVW